MRFVVVVKMNTCAHTHSKDPMYNGEQKTSAVCTTYMLFSLLLFILSVGISHSFDLTVCAAALCVLKGMENFTHKYISMQQQTATAVVKRIRRIWKRIKTKQPKKLRGNVYYFGKWKWIFFSISLWYSSSSSLGIKQSEHFVISLDRWFFKKKYFSFISKQAQYVVRIAYILCSLLCLLLWARTER